MGQTPTIFRFESLTQVLMGILVVVFVGAGGFAIGYHPEIVVWALSGGAPQVSMPVSPRVQENNTLRISYKAWDFSGIEKISLRITPKQKAANAASLELPLANPDSRKAFSIDSVDLTSHPYAGQDVYIQIVATNRTGDSMRSEAVPVSLPERRFMHPVARLLVEQRRKLMLQPDDVSSREETAAILSSVAYRPSSYKGDPVVLMALRSGAVRLVLENDKEAAEAVNEILWQAATRIEASNAKLSQRLVRP